MQPSFRAVIAGDHQFVRAGLRAAREVPDLINSRPGEVADEASMGLEAIEALKAQRPDLLLLDISMPQPVGAEILADIRRWSPDTPMVVIAAVTSTGLLSRIVESGVDGLFFRASDNTELFETLPIILNGGRHIESRLLDFIRDAAPIGDITPPRERQSLNMIVAGKSNVEIAVSWVSVPKPQKNIVPASCKRWASIRLLNLALKEGLLEEHGHLDRLFGPARRINPLHNFRYLQRSDVIRGRAACRFASKGRHIGVSPMCRGRHPCRRRQRRHPQRLCLPATPATGRVRLCHGAGGGLFRAGHEGHGV